MNQSYQSTPRPYIGVTGLMTNAEAEACVVAYREAWAAVDKDPSHDLMLGVLASEKTLNGQANRHPLRYPKCDDIRTIFPRHLPTPLPCMYPKANPDGFLRLNLVHVAPGKKNTAEALVRAMEEGGPQCLGLQINALWPDPRALEFFRNRYPYSRVVLQVGNDAVQIAAGGWRTPRAYKAVSTALALYCESDLITDVLFDVSGGEGRGVDPDLLWYDAASRRAKGPLFEMFFVSTMNDVHLAVGVAGGLSAETLGSVSPIFAGSSKAGATGCSIDAESGLRDDAEGGGNLDLAKVRSYFRAAVALALSSSPASVQDK